MTVKYQYPVVIYYSDDLESDDYEVNHYHGSITPIRIEKEPYEAQVNTMGFNFHILFGHQSNGWFLCVPNWNFGCELAHPSNLSWNMQSMTSESSKLSYEDATAIAYALNALSDYIAK